MMPMMTIRVLYRTLMVTVHDVPGSMADDDGEINQSLSLSLSLTLSHSRALDEYIAMH